MTGDGLTALRRFADQKLAEERCGFCALPLRAEHQHLVDPEQRRLVCACDACATLFPSTGRTKFLRVPHEVKVLRDFELSDLQWNAFGIPVALAFFFLSSEAGRPVAMYPSPAGAAEAPLDRQSWKDLVEANPVLQSLRPDVEALLVNRTMGAREYFVAPIDRCYGLTGLLRTQWRGFFGGDEAWAEIRLFFTRLHQEAHA